MRGNKLGIRRLKAISNRICLPLWAMGSLFIFMLVTPIGLDAASQTSPNVANARVNTSLPGARTGMLKMLTPTSADIDQATYTLAPKVVIATQKGVRLPVTSTWSKILRYPNPIRYWVTEKQITQIIVTVRE
jgi:hypothetical protein